MPNRKSNWIALSILIAAAGIIYIVARYDILADIRVFAALFIFIGVIVAVLLHHRSTNQAQNKQKDEQDHQ